MTSKEDFIGGQSKQVAAVRNEIYYFIFEHFECNDDKKVDYIKVAPVDLDNLENGSFYMVDNWAKQKSKSIQVRQGKAARPSGRTFTAEDLKAIARWDKDGGWKRNEVVNRQMEYWQKDSDVSECTICGRPFTFFKRRHHCRECGQIFCSECAPKPLAGEQRKCKMCAPPSQDPPSQDPLSQGESLKKLVKYVDIRLDSAKRNYIITIKTEQPDSVRNIQNILHWQFVSDGIASRFIKFERPLVITSSGSAYTVCKAEVDAVKFEEWVVAMSRQRGFENKVTVILFASDASGTLAESEVELNVAGYLRYYDEANSSK